MPKAQQMPLDEIDNMDAAPIIPAQLAIQAMRDSGYKNTAYALAELIDNSVQAKATHVEILCLEKYEQLEQRSRKRMSAIAVLDNGVGMNAAVLRQALQFGNGTRLNDRSGIGRFGMGLPNASISQAGRVEVWSWQNGTGNALYTYLDVEDVRHGDMTDVPLPRQRAVPTEWLQRAETIGHTGTLVVWTKLTADRMTWKTAKSTLKNTGWLVGRIHRRFINDNRLSIRLAGGEDGHLASEYAAINDPLYLLPSSHLEAPFNREAMFDEIDTVPIQVQLNENEEYTIITRYSMAKTKTIELAGTNDRGRMGYGKDAANNIGVSVIREGRELMLDRSWTNPSEPRDRWWGCEVEFPAALDEIFGVTNNKQAATVFTELATLDYTELLEPGEDYLALVARLRDEGDPKGVLLDVSQKVKENLDRIRALLRDQGRGRRAKTAAEPRHDDGDPTEEANDRWKQRDATNPLPDTDAEPTTADIEEIEEDLAEQGHDPEAASEIVARIVSGELKVIFVEKPLGGSGELFTVFPRGTMTEVVFNRRHPAFGMIFETVSSSADDDLSRLSTPEMQDRLIKATRAMKLLFIAWARMEREDAPNRNRYERLRENWGKLARDFLEPLEGEGFD